MWKLVLLLTLWSCRKHVEDASATVVPTLAHGTCIDTISNCADYGANICSDYKPWAIARCAAFCRFCTGAATTPAPPCIDTIPNCREYGTYICHDTILSKWTREHCLLYCKWCGYREWTSRTSCDVGIHFGNADDDDG